ncbi:HPP family protein [Oleispira antarctica RB-8]|uniref:HPP family protein n=1 Tax=Oleispira antarctica RB-8 TaxID=698738 RepID=R4YP85_OLEAN|nr:HPP family protein [Oleispira antarctica RB-8]|tara:strand:- start:2409 stop:2915 length:507 start_codon:yes stop_codon:yes gene_type:complete
MNVIKKLRGEGSALPPKPSIRNIVLAGIGGFITIAILAGLNASLVATLILGSFGASCVLVFGFPDAPFSQPRNVVAGHFLSSLIGLLCLTLFGAEWWSVSIAVGLAISLMMLTRTVHPPAGSNPVIVFLAQPGWDFLYLPTLSGAVIIILIALVYNNISRKERYPKYW